ncbi:MAG TPA: benzoate/H(+) symporter BenE family transporter [Dongiaceae bacterium]|jgi:benzoate membrane transport protein|nr:benzoate/H(+) symporter BenE family transporter [Dongiaceae bacterium]
MSLRSALVSGPNLTAGFLTMLVGVTSSIALVYQAAHGAGADSATIGSWIGALGLGMAAASIGLSLFYRSPVIIAYSTPGAALLVTALPHLSLNEATGAFLVSALLMLVCGLTGLFARAMNRIPPGIAASMLAGILARLAMETSTALAGQGVLIAGMFLTYLLGKRFWPRYAIMIVLAAGVVLVALQGQLHGGALTLSLTDPVFTAPIFSWRAIIGVGIPLFFVTMAGQNAPGVAVMRAHGYQTPISPLITVSGVTTLVLAPFGGFAFNLAAISAALCMGREAHADPGLRYGAAIFAGLFYLLLALFGATVGNLLSVFPPEFVTAIAGFALLGTIGSSLAVAMKDDGQRESALVTFLVTASGVSLFQVSSAFWGLIAGMIALVILRFSFAKVGGSISRAEMDTR